MPIQTRLFRPIDHACRRHRIIWATESILHGDMFPTQAMNKQPGGGRAERRGVIGSLTPCRCPSSIAPVRASRAMRKFVLIGRLLAATASVAAIVVFRPDQAARVATGLVSHTLCSETFVAGFDPLNPLPKRFSPCLASGASSRCCVNVDRTHKEVAASWPAGSRAGRSIAKGSGAGSCTRRQTAPWPPPRR